MVGVICWAHVVDYAEGITLKGSKENNIDSNKYKLYCSIWMKCLHCHVFIDNMAECGRFGAFTKDGVLVECSGAFMKGGGGTIVGGEESRSLVGRN